MEILRDHHTEPQAVDWTFVEVKFDMSSSRGAVTEILVRWKMVMRRCAVPARRINLAALILPSRHTDCGRSKLTSGNEADTFKRKEQGRYIKFHFFLNAVQELGYLNIKARMNGNT